MGKTINRLTTAGCAIAFLALGGQQAFAMSAACAAINADWSAGVSFPGIVGANQELAPAYSEQFDAGETIYWTASSSGTPAANPAEAYFSIIENFPGLNQFALERNDVANFNVSGRYTFSGGESVQVILQADNRGAPQEGNAANARITCSDGSTAGVSQSISSFVATRQALLAATVDHPGLQERRLQQAGQISATPSGDGMLLQFAQSTAIANPAGDAVNTLARAQQGEPQRFNVWVSGTARLHAQNASGVDHWGTFGLVSGGADYLITDSLLAGIAIHGDWLDDKTNAGTISGRGFLVGPYISAELAQGLYLDASALFGHTSNDVASNGYTGRFDTRRMLLDAKLSGLVKLRDDITLIPNVKAFYLTETADGYTLADIGGTPIAMPGFTQDTLQLSAGGRVEFHLVSDSEVTWTPFISGDAGLGWTGGRTDPFLRLGTGVDLSFGNAWSLGAAVDATVTANGANSVGARAKLAVRF